MKIIVDAMGGDNAPEAIVKGALDAVCDFGVEVVLVGKEEAIRACAKGKLPEYVQVVNATEVVEICDDPALAFKKKKDSSLTVGLTMLKNGEGDAFVSAGST
ncbi:MAG: phosphate--acyl-ACP acyltransferase, partial [Oscillibacter sp.]|nr:phosphate--acyl-ACP acyltransferase [Oscillibacter sp.]